MHTAATKHQVQRLLLWMNPLPCSVRASTDQFWNNTASILFLELPVAVALLASQDVLQCYHWLCPCLPYHPGAHLNLKAVPDLAGKLGTTTSGPGAASQPGVWPAPKSNMARPLISHVRLRYMVTAAGSTSAPAEHTVCSDMSVQHVHYNAALGLRICFVSWA